MTLLDSLYTITSKCTVTEGEHKYFIKLNPDSAIYKAHFPGNPITPGVCILQIAIELIQDALEKTLLVDTVKNVKFLKIIVPEETPEVQYQLQRISEEDDIIKYKVTVSAEEVEYAKLSLICRTNSHIL